MKRNVILLATCQALMMTSLSLIGTTSGLVGYLLADDKGLATLPHALQFVGMMCVTFPASLLMGRVGRRGGFLVGALVAIVGAGIASYAVLTGSFEWFCVGSFVVGCSNAFGQYYRFAAADVATEDYRSRAISLVLSGGIVAAFAGPNLAALTREWVESALFAGSYLSIVGIYIVSAAVISQLRMPHRAPAPGAGSGRSLREIALQPTYATALFCAVVAHGSMNLLMTATPLAMQARGVDFGSIAQVIQIHILGMYGPSFLTGHLMRRFGTLPIMQAGSGILAAAAATNLLGSTVVHFWFALGLLGIGWNFLFTGATALVTETYSPLEKAKAQGLNDLILFSFVAATALLSGLIHHAYGWAALNWSVLPGIALAAALLTWLRRRPFDQPVSP